MVICLHGEEIRSLPGEKVAQSQVASGKVSFRAWGQSKNSMQLEAQLPPGLHWN